MTDKEITMQKIQAILEKAGEREVDLIYVFARSITREDKHRCR